MSATAQNSVQCSRVFRRNLLQLRVEQLLERLEVVVPPEVEAALHEVYAELQAAKWPLDDCSRPKGSKATPESTESTAELAAAHVGGIDDHDHEVDQSRGVHFFNGKLKKSYRFVAPEKIEVVGSMLLKTLSKKTIDLAVYLPEAMWENKDHVNYRYADKRAAYVSVLYKNLERAKNHGKRSFNVTIDPVDGNPTRPAITVHLEASPWKVRILPCMAPSDEPENLQAPRGNNKSTGANPPAGTQRHFQEMKLQLWKNCLRRRGPTTAKQSEGQETDKASPYYNAALLEELYMKRILLLQHQCLEHQPALRPAIILLKRWLSVRFFENMGLECPMGVLACYVAMCGSGMHGNGNGLGSLSAGRTTKTAMRDPMQVFKATLSWIAQQYDQAARNKTSSAAEVPVEKHHFAGSGGCLQQIIKNAVKRTSSTTAPHTSSINHNPASSATTSHIDAALEAGMRSVAVEPLNLFVGELNIFHKFPKPVLADVAFEARLTLKVLDADRDQFAFEQVFAVQQRPEFHWDSLVAIDVGGKSAAAVSAPQYGFASRWPGLQDHRVLGHDGHLPRKKHQSDELFANNVDGEADLHDSEAPWAVLAVERAVAILERGLGPRLLRSCVRVLPERRLALIGLKLSTPRVEKTVLRGPSADDVEAVEAWKKLWRENLEVRRFRDGNIQQCTVFAAVEGAVPPLAIQITDHLMKQHFPEDAARLELGPQAITLPPHEVDVWTDFEQLRDLLMDAELPLAVSRVAPSSRGFSYSNSSCGADENEESLVENKVILNNSEKTVEEAVVELEWSSLWPRDCEQAIGVFEGSFLNEVRKQLAEMAGVNAHLGDETWSLLCSTTSDLSASTCESAALATSKVPRPFLDVVYPTRVFRLRIFYAYKPSITANAQFLTFGSHVKGKDIAAVLRAVDNGEPQDADAGINAGAAEGAEEGGEAVQDTRSPAASSFDGRDSLSELRDNWWRPRVRQAFHTLTLQQPNFPLCLQLVNKWLSAKWLLRGFEDFYEHLVALLFSKVTTVFCGLPTTANAGFARFLWLVANALSGERPLVLEDFGYAPPEIQGAETGLQLGFTQIQSGDNKHEQQQMSEEQLHLLQNSFERRRGSNRKHVVALCSRYDPHGVFVTTPSFSMLSKLREHAAAALKLLQTTNDVGWLHDHQVQTVGAPRPAHAGAVDVKSRCSSAERVRPSFPPPRACFDALFTKPEFDLEIHLDPRSGSKSGIMKHPHFSDVYELMVRDTRELLFRRLQAKYGSWAVLYRNRGNAIGFEWRPEAFSSGVQGGDLDAENAGGEHGGAGRVDHDITTSRGTPSTQKSAQNNVNGKKRRRVDESGVESRENKKERGAGSASFSSIKRLMARGCSYAATSGVEDEESVLPDTDLLLQDVRSWVHKSIPFRLVQN